MADFVDPHYGEDIRMEDLDLSNESDYAQMENNDVVEGAIGDEIEMAELSQRDRIKDSAVHDLFEKYEKVWYKIQRNS